MNPVAFSIFGIDVMWYGVLISTGVLIGVLIALKEAKRTGFKEDNLIDFLLYAIPLGIVGARAYYVIFSLDFYSQNLSQIINIRNGGLAIHGAVIAGVITAILFCKKRKIHVLELIDLVIPSLILGQSIGRWGNFVNQEAHGGPTDLPWGIMINGQKVHPTFLYESIFNILIFIFLIWFRKYKKANDGQVFGLYLILYSAVRYFVEGLRTDSLMFMGMRVAQLISIALIILGAALLLYVKPKNRDGSF